MKKRKAAQADEIELRPDGWERFERAVDAAIKAGPLHRKRTDQEMVHANQTAKPRKSPTGLKP